MIRITESTVENSKNPIGIKEKNPRISWKFSSSNQNVLQTAYLIQVSKNDRFESHLVWDSGKNESETSLYIPYNGKELQTRTRYYFRIKIWDNQGEQSEWSDGYFWEMGLLQDEWKAGWITPEINDKRKNPHHVFYFRKKFYNNKPISKARIYASALGLYDIHLNCKRVGEEYFTPGFTVYEKHLQYQVYELPTESIINVNTIGVTLAEGWYRGKLMGAIFNKKKLGAIILQLILTHPDGSETVISTNETWKVSTGPILESGIYDGEVYDARLETRWLEQDFNDNDWPGVKTHSVSIPNFNSSLGEKVKKIEEITPKEIIDGPNESCKIIDMGQNMVGFLRLRLKDTIAGQKIVVRHGELMDGDDIYTKNLRDAKARLEYICKGAEEEIYEPSFTFMGFQFVKITGYDNVTLNTVTGIVIHSDMKKIGSFECSNDLLNKLQQNIEWGLKGNFLDIPTDCPQRNERLGWTGDANVFAPTANYIMDTNRFFTKWLKDLRLDQHKNGSIPPVIPNVFVTSLLNGSTGWSDIATMLPWQLYLDYGDTQILENSYESMKSWCEHYYRRAKKTNKKRNKKLRKVEREFDEHIITSGPQFFGDWLAPGVKKNSWFARTKWIATAWYAHSVEILAKTAKILGKDQDAKYYSNLFQKIKHAFKVKFLEPDGSIYKGFQTIYANALYFNLIPNDLKTKSAQILAEDVKKNSNHLTTGFLGTPYLTWALSENGQLKTAYDLLLQETVPSWLYPVTCGATTIWERWDGIFPGGAINKGGINDPSDMCSFNHYAYGAIGDWLYKVVAGINYMEEKPGYKSILIKPQPGGNLSKVTASLESRYGLVESSWKIEGEIFTLKVVIPPNTTATVQLPDGSDEIQIGSGSYEYSCSIPK
ncbi:MAG: family 78 glycoside hydrolase catalytic domain [Promethearchaeota archaeon]